MTLPSACKSTSRYLMPSPYIALQIDPTGMNLGSENGDPNITAFLENRDARPNAICRTGLVKTKCHSAQRPRRLTGRNSTPHLLPERLRHASNGTPGARG